MMLFNITLIDFGMISRILYSSEIICSLIICFVIYLYWKLTFWKRQSIPNLMTYAFKVFTNPMHSTDRKCVKQFGNIVGYYEFLTPVILIAEPSLVNEVLVKKFRNFSDHKVWVRKEQPLGLAIAFLPYKEWKDIRLPISKFLSLGNLKKMECIFVDCTNSMISKWESLADNNNDIDIKPYVDKCFLEILLRTHFGIKTDATNLINIANMLKYKVSLKQLFSIIAPTISNIFGINFPDKKVTDFLTAFIEKIIEERKAKNFNENDFIQHFIDGENEEIDVNGNKCKALNRKELIDNSLLLIGNGTETSSEALIHLIYCLAANPSTQEMLINEIDEYTNPNKPLIEAINQMTYLELCLKETLRLFPSGVKIERKAIKDTMLGNIFVPKNSYVSIPVYAIQRDPENFGNSEDFIPERFSADKIHKIKSGTYLPFALGPRNCIGIHFAHLMIKIAIVEIMKKFRFDVCDGFENTVIKRNLAHQEQNLSNLNGLINFPLCCESDLFFSLRF